MDGVRAANVHGGRGGEGGKRARRAVCGGARTMHIGGYDPIPKRLYASIGGPDGVRSMSGHRYLPRP
ncbi:MAG: hypothetical protein PHV11_03985 [Candidatus Bipolaricaulis sp.]|nr:hypothetical protein [Candidatus Bipolaricaulis sp.]MDD5219709.1 hypothetical protein [Candidatus Bipolaricaulis sp.]